jgi:glucokinase
VPARLILAVDIGATKTLLTVRSVDALAEGWSARHPVVRIETSAEASKLVEWVAIEAARIAASIGGGLVAAGIAAPGPLDAERGVVTRSSNLGWSDIPITSMVTEHLGIPAALEDDGNTAAIGEWHFGAGQGTDPFGYLTASSGIGGGIVVGGNLVRGVAGNAGEVGHIVIDTDGPLCACGRRGDVESYAGGAALARRAADSWPGGSMADGKPAPGTAEEIFQAARYGNAQAARLVDDAITALAVALAALASVIEPEMIVVGGSIGLGQPDVVREAESRARERVLRENGRSLQVKAAALGNESVLAGAADLALRTSSS